MTTGYDDRRATLLERLDPRTSLVAATGAALCFSCVRGMGPAFACLGFALALAAVRRLSPALLLRQLAAANLFILFIWLTVPLTMPGESVAGIGPLNWSREGVALALAVTVKSNAILLAFIALVSGIGLPHVGYALERLRVPAKLVFLFLFTWRYIHVVGEEWRRLQTAAKLRGFAPRNSLHTYRTIGNMLGLTLVNAMDRSRKIHEAMLLRGFAGRFHTVGETRRAPADVAFSVFFFTALCGLLIFDYGLV